MEKPKLYFRDMTGRIFGPTDIIFLKAVNELRRLEMHKECSDLLNFKKTHTSRKDIINEISKYFDFEIDDD